MIKHHRVQIAPVAVKAAFCVRESFSAGRQKSDTPARTIDHYIRVLVDFMDELIQGFVNGGIMQHCYYNEKCKT